MGNGRFTTEELQIAKNTDLCDIAGALGYTVKRVGQYHTLKEMDSIRIYNRRSWFRWSRQYGGEGRGGSQIDFLKAFAGMDIREAVSWLLDFTGYRGITAGGERAVLEHQAQKGKAGEKKRFELPPPAYDNRYLYSYLGNERAVSRDVIDHFVGAGLVYEAKGYHNIVFKGNDKEGATRFASMRGVFDKGGKGYKCDVAGSDKSYGFNLYHEGSREVIVFEAAIDAMSYVDIFQDYENSLLALGMLSDAPLATFLSEHPQIQGITFCLDNDGPGRRATGSLMQKYYGLGYEVEDKAPPEGCKDYNQWLQETKRAGHRAYGAEQGKLQEAKGCR